MPKLARIVALILVTLWLPTMAHCELEALGLLPSESTEDGCCRPAEGCEDDACNLIEGQSFSFAKNGLQAPAPEIKLHECLSCLLAAISARDSALALLPGEYVERALAWTPTWQFTRRAAPLSRAPSTLV